MSYSDARSPSSSGGFGSPGNVSEFGSSIIGRRSQKAPHRTDFKPRLRTGSTEEDAQASTSQESVVLTPEQGRVVGTTFKPRSRANSTVCVCAICVNVCMQVHVLPTLCVCNLIAVHISMRSKSSRCRARVTPARSPCRAHTVPAFHACGSASPFCARCCHSYQKQIVS
jgi:hypothetical protein